MVKNVKGGSSHKSQARKHAIVKESVVKTRLALEEGEIYAQVVKLLGNGMCHVLCQDGIIRLCIIRGKFKYRGRRDNTLSNNKWVLVGLREYESEKLDNKKLQNCDLLEIYSDQDKERLKAQAPNVNWRPFILNDISNTSGSNNELDGDEKNEELIFSDEREEEYKLITEKMKEGESTKIDFNKNINDTLDDINIDDI